MPEAGTIQEYILKVLPNLKSNDRIELEILTNTFKFSIFILFRLEKNGWSFLFVYEAQKTSEI